jgi:hypothetical protein
MSGEIMILKYTTEEVDSDAMSFTAMGTLLSQMHRCVIHTHTQFIKLDINVTWNQKPLGLKAFTLIILVLNILHFLK